MFHSTVSFSDYFSMNAYLIKNFLNYYIRSNVDNKYKRKATCKARDLDQM